MRAIDASKAVEQELRRTRRVLNADELVSMTERRPRLEAQFGRYHAYLFSIDGVLNGAAVTGAVFAGECMLTFAPTFERAYKLAADGLESTVEFLYQQALHDGVAPTILSQGLSTDIGGRKAGAPNPDPLSRLPKLKSLLAHHIGGMPWKW